MARYRYTINHPNLKAAARVSDIPTKRAIERLSPETPSNDPDPVPVQELLISRESDSLLSSSESCSQDQITKSAKREPIWNVVSGSMAADHHEILVGPEPTTLQAYTPLMKQESAPGKALSVKAESTIIVATEDMAIIPSRIEEESSPPTCYLLKLPVAVRTRIYGYLFGKPQAAVLGSGEAGELKVRFTKRSGIALCFTCRHIEEESGPILYKHLHWGLKKDTPFVSLLSTQFHRTKLIQNVVIFPDGIVQNLNGLAHNQAQFGSLHEVSVFTDGRVFTNKAPNRQPWTQLAVSLKKTWAAIPPEVWREAPDRQPWTQWGVNLKKTWAALPPEVWRAAKLLDTMQCKVRARVDCLYYPYMMGKRRDWHEKMGSWCSRVSSSSEGMKSRFADVAIFQWCIDLNSGEVTRVSDRPTQVISGIWPTNGFRFQGHGVSRIRVFDEHQIISEYAGQDGNPFKKAW